MEKKFINTKKCVKIEKVSELRGITVPYRKQLGGIKKYNRKVYGTLYKTPQLKEKMYVTVKYDRKKRGE